MMAIELPRMKTDPLAPATPDASPSREIVMDRITGSYKIMRRKVRDRWVWLVLGVVAFVLSFVVIFKAHGAEPPPEQPAAVVAAGGEDPIVDAVKTSGPAAGLVIILGYFLRTWQADIRTEIGKLENKIETASNSDGSMRVELAQLHGHLGTLRAENAALVLRVERLERRSSGTHPRGE